MKKLLWLLSAFSIALYADTQTERIAQKLSMLEKEIRSAPTTLTIPYDPFFPRTKSVKKRVRRDKNHTRHHPKYRRQLEVTMILNKKAFINGKWIKENQKIADYVVTKIDKDTVFLKRRGKTIALPLISGKSILITKEE
jgi:hypothetical protein